MPVPRTSWRQRQEKLTEVLSFLDQQAPELQQRVNQLQNQLSAFRQLNSFVEPGEQATAIQVRREELRTRSQELEQTRAQLQGQAAVVRSGRLNSPAFQRGGGVGSDGELAGGAFASLRQDLTRVEKELAEAEANFTESAPQLQRQPAEDQAIRRAAAAAGGGVRQPQLLHQGARKLPPAGGAAHGALEPVGAATLRPAPREAECAAQPAAVAAAGQCGRGGGGAAARPARPRVPRSARAARGAAAAAAGHGASPAGRARHHDREGDRGDERWPAL